MEPSRRCFFCPLYPLCPHHMVEFTHNGAQRWCVFCPLCPPNLLCLQFHCGICTQWSAVALGCGGILLLHRSFWRSRNLHPHHLDFSGTFLQRPFRTEIMGSADIEITA